MDSVVRFQKTKILHCLSHNKGHSGPREPIGDTSEEKYLLHDAFHLEQYMWYRKYVNLHTYRCASAPSFCWSFALSVLLLHRKPSRREAGRL